MTGDKRKPLTWLWLGILLGTINAIAANVYLSDRLIGASTAYPWLSGILFRLSESAYMKQISIAGAWELFFIAGALVGSLASSVVGKNFRLQAIPRRWQAVKGGSKAKRMSWAFAGGFLLIIGARLADGCTSGHILSGGMQLAVSSLVFAVVVAASFLITGRIFYGRRSV